MATRKALETYPTQDNGKAKIKSSQSQSLEDMCNVIKTLSDKLNRLELENKNFQRQTQYNKNFNPQYRRQPLQILQKERKYQNQIQAPLYIEEGLGEEQPENQISTLYAVDEDELGIEGEEYVYDEADAIHNENEIDEYWKHFYDFM